MKNLLLFCGLFTLLVQLVIGATHGALFHDFSSRLWSVTHREKLASLLDSQNPILAFTIAEHYFNHGDYNIKKAEEYYTRAIELNPNYLEAYYQRGRIQFINGHFIAALTDINTVLRLDPEFEKGYYMYGLISGYAKNFDQAEYGFKEFIKRDPINWAGYNDLAWVYFKQGNFEKTREVAAAGLIHAPTNAWLNNIYGTALMNLGDTAGAKIAFEKALEKSESMTGDDWGRAYPGNDPTLYESGIEETRSVIRHNLSLLDSSAEH